MPTPRRRSADTPRRGRRTTERDQPYSQETQEALEAFIGELAVMPPPVVLIFHGLLNGRSLDEIAATLHTTQSQALALIDKARREHPMVADARRRGRLRTAKDGQGRRHPRQGRRAGREMRPAFSFGHLPTATGADACGTSSRSRTAARSTATGREAGADRREVLPDGRGDARKPRSRLPIA